MTRNPWEHPDTVYVCPACGCLCAGYLDDWHDTGEDVMAVVASHAEDCPEYLHWPATLRPL